MRKEEIKKQFQKNQKKIDSRKTTKEERKRLIAENRKLLEELNQTEEQKFSFDVYYNNGFKDVIYTTESKVLQMPNNHPVVMIVKMFYDEKQNFQRETIFIR